MRDGIRATFIPTRSSQTGTHPLRRLLGASWQPWMLAGMGLILFVNGRFFSTVVGFVVARRLITTEGADAISTAIATGRTEPEEA